MEAKPCKLCSKPRYSVLSWCWTHYRARETEKRQAKLLRAKERKDRRKEKKENSFPVLKRRLDKVFSEHVRRKAADPNGNITCVCCGNNLHWKQAQAMHYISRSKLATRWSLGNVYAGDYRCNIALKGNYPAFTRFLLEEFGAGHLKNLIAEGEKIVKFTPETLKALIKQYSL